MNFKQFYASLDKKVEFRRAFRERCKVSHVTIDMWGKGDSQTHNPEYLSVLSEMTGIPQESLFA